MTFRKMDTAYVVSLLKFHHGLLEDAMRTSAYRRAIESTVRPGDIVADLGCGTGVLAIFAALAGAKHVYAIDEQPVIEVARQIARDNGLEDRITFLHASSYDAMVPERVDVLVTETMGNTGLDEGIVGAVRDARRRWMQSGGRVIPQSIDTLVALVDDERLETRHALWRERPYGIDFSRLGGLADNTPVPFDLERSRILSSAETLWSVDLQDGDGEGLRGSASLRILRNGTMRGVGAWFRARLSNDIVLSNEPGSACRSWKQTVFPVPHPVQVREGDEVRVAMQTFDGIEWRWSVTAGEEVQEGTTVRGFPLIRA